MYIIKNAFINLFRNRGRNVMMGIIIFVVIVLSGTSIIIHSASNAIIDDYKNRFGSEVSLNVIKNHKKMLLNQISCLRLEIVSICWVNYM